jgi:hypothetical protein
LTPDPTDFLELQKTRSNRNKAPDMMLLPGVNFCCCSSIRELSKAASDAASNSSDYSNQ